VFVITQDADGYLWLGGPNGLVRFDGSRFQPWTQQAGVTTLPASPVSTMARASRGGLWIGFAGGAGVARMNGAEVVRYLPADGAPPGVNALLEDRHGTLWAASGHGLFQFADNRWRRLTADDGYEGEQAFSVYEDRAGRVWVGAKNGLYRSGHGGLRLFDASATNVESVMEDDAGGVWVTDRTSVVRRLGSPGVLRLHPSIRRPLPGWRILRAPRGGLIISSFSGGLFRLDDPSSAEPLLEPLAYEHRLRGSPRGLFRDREDNVWVGMRGGLLRLAEHTFQSAPPLDGLNHDGVRTAAVGGDGALWIATTHALNRFAGDVRESFPLSQTRALHTDRSQRLWIAADDVVGRYESRRVIAEPIPDIQGSRVNSLTTTDDTLWLCTGFRGVLSWDNRVVTSHRQPGEPARQCLAILADRRDRVWAAFTSGGVALHEGGIVRQLTADEGLAPGAVLQILEARDGAIWFAAAGGVSRYQDGRLTTITPANAPLDSVVPVLLEDDQGYMWVGIRSGAALVRFHPREMDKIAADRSYRIIYTLFDESDGLQPGTQLWQSGAGGVRDRQGRLWIANGPGMTIIDPNNLLESRRPSPPRIDAITVDGERTTPFDGRDLPHGATVQIDFAVLSLSSASKLRFRHLLDGVDPTWVYDDEERQARYRNLPQGDYRFLVSTTHDGQWTDPAVWTFTVVPPFYLNSWFLAVAGIAVAGGVGAGTWLRIRSVKTRYALVFAERTRLSREIHDTLLQSLAALGPELEALATKLTAEQEEVAAELRRVRRQVGRSVRDARDSILQLRRHPMEQPRLADSLTELADLTNTRHGVRPQVVIDGKRPDDASSEVDMQLFRIAQEAVTNAMRHGRATCITITVAYTTEQVQLAVTDNGCGFTPEEQTTWTQADEHFGLVTMRERAEKIGGQLDIESAPGQGTTVRTVARVTTEWL
jgi:ligand-binding sensor domain-containing protein/signal transduction histidine kinase